MKKDFKIIDGIKTAYIRREGDGIPVVILHGWGANIESIMPIVNSISGRSFLAYDAPGFGDSDEPTDVWSTYDYSDFLIKVLKEFEIDRAIFIGHSFGGKTLTCFAPKHEDMVEKLVLVDASGVLPKRKMSYYFKVYSFKFLKNMYKLLFFWKKDSLEKFYKRFGSDDYRDTSGIMRSTFVKVVNESTEEEFSKINSDTLLIWGERDDATPVYMGRIFEKKIKNSGLVVLNGGHYSYLDDYGTFCAVINSYLGDIDG